MRDGGRAPSSPLRSPPRPRECGAMWGGRYESSSISPVRLWGAAGPLRSLLPSRAVQGIYREGRL